MNRGIQIAVFFDELPFLGNPSGGIARSTVGLAEALGRLSLAVMAVGVRKSHFLDPLTPSVSACNWRYLPWISRKSAWIRNLARRGLFLLFSRIRRRGFKIVYHSNGIGSDPWIASRADLHVVTIHDLIPERLDRPDSLPKTSAVLQRKQSLKTSHGLIWVSLKTRKEFRRYYPHIRLGGRVIPHGRPPETFRTPQKSTRAHFLMVGNRGGYKNSVLVYQAMALFSKHKRPRLCLAGGEPPSREEVKIWDQLRIASSIVWKSCSDQELATWYAAAFAVVVPSTIEGFGLPALEAMACGRTVICLKGSGVDELVAGAGIILPNNSPTRLFGVMRSLLFAPCREKYEKKALRRARQFDWEKTATMTAEFYQWLLAK